MFNSHNTPVKCTVYFSHFTGESNEIKWCPLHQSKQLDLDFNSGHQNQEYTHIQFSMLPLRVKSQSKKAQSQGPETQWMHGRVGVWGQCLDPQYHRLGFNPNRFNYKWYQYGYLHFLKYFPHLPTRKNYSKPSYCGGKVTYVKCPAQGISVSWHRICTIFWPFLPTYVQRKPLEALALARLSSPPFPV